ncbi:MAG: L-seryl-tRNA(Sec) selenium transferase [Candidatus Eisenbacteria bacterium RBG_16_71_46]|nr:MAG: L-seryl-tRNA(Sec) selenium transferase [Candidatus Eisenbacteria bacterium RBG_16_71_46]
MSAPAPKPLRTLPAVETLLRHPALGPALAALPRSLVVEAVRAEIAAERARLRRAGGAAAAPEALAGGAAARALAAGRPMLRRVLNATGVVLHTNLGRAPLSAAARRAVEEVARGYSSLEYDLVTGRRGDRGIGVERWLTRLTGAEAALVVNNGAAAILLALAALATGRTVIVSRGELVEIGGSFRIPEIMERSGARLAEVGTTNRTHLRDYERALERHGDTAAILRVHPSNFRLAGFTTRPTLAELARLAHRRRVLLIEDLGSGALVDLAPFGLESEPTVRESLTAGCDVVTFSGDKLLGATQAGLILGGKGPLGRIRRDSLARALRVDKLTLAALEATLPEYVDPERAARDIPALAMLHADEAALERRAGVLAERLERALPGARARVARGAGEVGGGALPLQRLPGWVVSLEWPGRSAGDLEALARSAEPPVIGYIRGGKLRLDVRTLTDDDALAAAEALGRAAGHPGA